MMPKKHYWVKNLYLKQLALGISVLFHPLFIILYFIGIIYWLNPPTLIFHDEKTMKLITVSLLASTVFLPLIAIFMMKGLHLISSLEMKDKKERIGPLIVTSLFYLWMYLNLSQHSYVPDYISYFILGTLITLFVSFLLNLFFKLSLHAAGISGLIIGLLVVIQKYQYQEISFSVFGKVLLIDSCVVLMFLLLVAGIVGSARLFLQEHTQKEIYIGYAVGSLAMLMANGIIW